MEQQYVIFSLNKEEYGVEITEVKEIVQMQDITNIPQTLDFILGLINLRGRIIPVVDLKKCFYGKETVPVETTRIIIVNIGAGQVVGILVDNVSEVLRLSDDVIEPQPTFLKKHSARAGIQGIGKLDNRLLILLNIPELFSEAEIHHIIESIA